MSEVALSDRNLLELILSSLHGPPVEVASTLLACRVVSHRWRVVASLERLWKKKFPDFPRGWLVPFGRPYWMHVVRGLGVGCTEPISFALRLLWAYFRRKLSRYSGNLNFWVEFFKALMGDIGSWESGGSLRLSRYFTFKAPNTRQQYYLVDCTINAIIPSNYALRYFDNETLDRTCVRTDTVFQITMDEAEIALVYFQMNLPPI